MSPTRFLISSFSGWVIVVFTGITVLLPYLLRRQTKSATPYLKRMRIHYWIGYGIALLSALHGWMAMQTLRGTHTNATGLWLATVAFLLMLLQATTGLQLQSKSLNSRRIVRKFHFGIMLAIVILSVAHILLNS